MRRPAARLAGAVAMAAALAAAWATAASAATSAETIALLNATRAGSGIPAALVEDPALSAGCAAHDAYMALNRVLTHTEVPGSPGYSAAGAYAGQNAVLTQGVGWSTGNPYLAAPLHLDQLLAPRLLKLGSADAYGFSCTTTFPGWIRQGPLLASVYTYPGPGVAVPPSEVAVEVPFTPGQLIGVPAGTRTGPYLLVLADGPGQTPFDNPATLSGATLTGPFGPVPVRTVDGTTVIPGGGRLATYMSPGGFMIPLLPLAPYSVYHAHVAVGFGGATIAHDWAFVTGGLDPGSRLQAGNGRIRLSSLSSARMRVTFLRTSGETATPLTIAPGHSAPLRLAPGSWTACGFQPAHGSFAESSQCLMLVVTGRPGLRLGAPRLRHGRLVFPLRFTAILRGRRAIVTAFVQSARCPGNGCRRSVRWRAITLGRDPVSVRVPARGQRLRVTVQTSAFQVRDAPWAAASTSIRYSTSR